MCILLYWQLMPTFSVRAYRQMPTLSVRAYHQIPVLSVRAYHLNPLRPHLLSAVLSPTQIHACHPIFPWAIFRGCSVLVTVVYRERYPVDSHVFGILDHEWYADTHTCKNWYPYPVCGYQWYPCVTRTPVAHLPHGRSGAIPAYALSARRHPPRLGRAAV